MCYMYTYISIIICIQINSSILDVKIYEPSLFLTMNTELWKCGLGSRA